jgi:hypothetical protein
MNLVRILCTLKALFKSAIKSTTLDERWHEDMFINEIILAL